MRRVLVSASLLVACSDSASTPRPDDAPAGTARAEAAPATAQPKAPLPVEAPAAAPRAPVDLTLPSLGADAPLGPHAAVVWIGKDGVAVSKTLDGEGATVALPLTAGSFEGALDMGELLPARLLDAVASRLGPAIGPDVAVAVVVDASVPHRTVSLLELTLGVMQGPMLLRFVTHSLESPKSATVALDRSRPGDEQALSLHVTELGDGSSMLSVSHREVPLDQGEWQWVLPLSIGAGACSVSAERRAEAIESALTALCRQRDQVDVALAPRPETPFERVAAHFAQARWPEGCSGQFRLEQTDVAEPRCDGAIEPDRAAASLDERRRSIEEEGQARIEALTERVEQRSRRGR